MKSIIIVLISLSLAFQVDAQEDSIDIQDIIIVSNSILEDHIGTLVQEFSNDALHNTGTQLDATLQNNSSVYIKSYGAGSLATSSVRGGRASHTSVLWNGLPIRNIMVGLTDLSLIPIEGIDKVSLHKGGNSTLFGSGSVASTINLNNRPTFQKKRQVEARIGLGSFDHLNTSITSIISDKNWFSKTFFQFRQAENNFSYPLGSLPEERTNDNAALDQYNIMQAIAYRSKSVGEINLNAWIQNSNRQIPPRDVQSFSEAYQVDRSQRLSIEWKKILAEKIQFSSMAGAINEDIDYYDPVSNLESLSNFKTLLFQTKAKYFFNEKNQLSSGFAYQYSQAETLGYALDPVENKYSWIGSYRYAASFFKTEITARQEIVDGQLIPTIANIGAEILITPHVSLLTKVSKNYNLPSFNDRYWKVGGNPELLAEDGWSEEISAVYKWEHARLSLQTMTSLYNRNIDNWILWSPENGGFIWKAQNLVAVRSRGIEQEIQATYKNEELEINLDAKYAFTKSTSKTDVINQNIQAGDQLIYTPEHTGTALISLKYKSISGTYNYRYVGSVQGVNTEINAYHVSDFHLAYSSDKQAIHWQIAGSINNLGDQNFYIIENRPMMGRNYQLTFTIKI